MKTKLQLLLLSILTLLTGGAAASCGDIAMRYLKAIDDMDWQVMRSLLAEDAWYTDPTMTHYDRPAIDLRGADAVVKFWRSASEDSGTSNIEYNVSGCFETAGYAMVNLDIRITVAGEFWNVAKDKIVIPGKVVSIVRVVDGKVAEHHDYVDYAGADRIVEELQSKHGTAD